jgi:metal transporter CNNM
LECVGSAAYRVCAARAGEIIPQAVCTRYGLAVGAYSAWIVQALMVLTSPMSYPLSRLLDWVLGSEQSVRRAAAASPGG